MKKHYELSAVKGNPLGWTGSLCGAFKYPKQAFMAVISGFFNVSRNDFGVKRIDGTLYGVRLSDGAKIAVFS